MRNRIIYIIAILGLALGMAACTTEPQFDENWELTNVSLADTIENISCEEIDSATRQVTAARNAAVDFDEADQEVLSTLGLWKDDSFDELTWEGNPQAPEDAPQHAGIKQRLEDRRAECADGTPSSTPSPPPTIAATSGDCVEGGSPLTYDPNRDMNVVSDGVQNRKEDLENIKADPRNLAYRAHDLGFWEDPNNWKSLTENDGKCLSREGETVYAKVEGALTASSTKVNENAQANPSWYNTGMGADGPVVNPTAGITGNLDAIVYELADGTKVVVLKRCANLALPAPPKHYHKTPVPGSTPPPGKGGPPPVTQPPGQPPVTQPPGTTQPPPPPVCPPGTTGKPPVCKDTEAAGPARVVPPQQQPNPLPLRPDHAQPTRPASPLPVYTPPPPPPPVVVPPAQGGPVPIETPRYTPPPETGAPAPSAPETECIPAPGMTSC